MDEFKIRAETADEAFARLKQAARRIDAGDTTTREFGLSAAHSDQLFDLLNANRWRLLNSLRRRGASSIRALAQSLGRDYKAVHTDVTKLIAAGLIERDDAGRISVPWTGITVELGGSDVEAA